MLNVQRIIIENFVEELKKAYHRTYSHTEPEIPNIIAWVGRLSLENISNSDMLFHNLEHTVMVTLAGQTILEGKHLAEGGVTPQDWLHVLVALLCHDIGYVRGVCKADRNGDFATGIGDETITLPETSTDIALTPYHIDRSKLFVKERFGGKQLTHLIDANRVIEYIELTRFPIPEEELYQQTNTLGGIVRAADFIGQLGDPNYRRKVPALFFEFEKTGMNKKFGYKSPQDIRENYSQFYWQVVRPYIEDALYYLRLTQEGKQWIACLHSHVFASEHDETI